MRRQIDEIPAPPGPGGPQAFSILELLVAMAVVALLALVVISIADNTARLTGSSQRRMSADSAARGALDRLAADFSALLLRKDLPDLVEKRVGNDRLLLAAQVAGYGGDRGISRVNYLVSDYPAAGVNDAAFDPLVLLRGAEGTGWDTNSLAFGGTNTATGFDAEALEVAAPDVFRFEVVFLMADGSILSSPPGAGVAPGTRRLLAENDESPSQQVRAIIIGVAALDSKLRALLPPDGMETLAARFPDAVSGGTDLLSQWSAVLEGSELPPPVLQGVRVSQRYFNLQRP